MRIRAGAGLDTGDVFEWSPISPVARPRQGGEAELARDLHGVLEKVARQGIEVVVEQNEQPVVVLRPALPPRRKISEVLALMPKSSTATMDAEFARDVQGAIESHREALEPPVWALLPLNWIIS